MTLPEASPAPEPDLDAQRATVDLWDWRRRIGDLYSAIRVSPDPERAWTLWCETRSDLYGRHPQSPIEETDRSAYCGPAVYPYDPALRFEVPLAHAPANRLGLPAGHDGAINLDAFARTDGLTQTLGRELTLYWIGGYGGGVFLPFADATSGRETYGGGRYLLDTIKGADLGSGASGVILDFNFAYFPSCAHSSRYICPLAPRGNRLPVAIRGGERHPANAAAPGAV